MGSIINCNLKKFNIRQNANKIFPNNSLSDNEKLLTRNLALELFNRFNYGKRGNYIGNFLDIGAFGEWNFFPTYVVDNKSSSSFSGKTKLIHSDLRFTNVFNYGVTACLGFNKYVIYSSYRLSNVFRSSSNFAELPRFIIGLQLGLHQ